MRAERRGRVARGRLAVNRQGREEPGERAEVAGQAVSDLQVEGLGSVREGQGQQGRGGSRRAVDRAVRGGPGPELAQDLEPYVVGLVLPAAGESGGDPQGRRQRGPGARGADRGRPDRPDGSQAVSGAGGGADLPSGLLRLPAGKVRAGCGRRVPAAVLAGGLGDRYGHPGVLRHRSLGPRAQGGRSPCLTGPEVDPAVCAAVAQGAAADSRTARWSPGIAEPPRGQRSHR